MSGPCVSSPASSSFYFSERRFLMCVKLGPAVFSCVLGLRRAPVRVCVCTSVCCCFLTLCVVGVFASVSGVRPALPAFTCTAFLVMPRVPTMACGVLPRSTKYHWAKLMGHRRRLGPDSAFPHTVFCVRVSVRKGGRAFPPPQYVGGRLVGWLVGRLQCHWVWHHVLIVQLALRSPRTVPCLFA